MDRSSAKILPVGSILLSTRATVGEVSISMQECATNQGFQSLVISNDFNNEFCYYLMQTKKLELITKASGSTFIEISNKEVKNISCLIPIIQEQQKIASFLTLLDKRIARQRELVESLKLYKRGVFKNIFSSISQFRKLQDISGYLTSDISLESIGNKSSGNFPVYDASGISLYISDYKIESDYIAIIKDGSGVGRLQYCSGKSSFIGTLGGIVANGCSVAYLYAAMQMIDFRQFVTGATIPHIYYKDYKNIAIPFPDFETQRKIERVSELLDRDIVIADEKICLLNKLREGLLQQLFI